MARHSSREGDVLAGRYRLGPLLGAGGMGEVYRAENTSLGRAVAIKVLKEEHADRAEVVMRFLREARAATIVRHPNVVDVIDVGQAEDGTPFIVQELLEGEDLASFTHAHGGRIPVREAVQILLPVVDAVQFAHGKGVIHRDLKPENIFLAQDASGAMVPKLLDFGISRIVTAEEQRMTATGMSIGTPAYMSPEQIRADAVIDARTDIWSFGVIMHEIIAGALPFTSESPGGLFIKIVTEPPMALDVALPGVGSDIAAVVARCLRPRAVDRYASAADLARDLRAVAAGAPPEALRTVAGPTFGARAPELRGTQATQAAPSIDPSLVPDLALPVRVPSAKPAAPPQSVPSRAPAAPPASRAASAPSFDMQSEMVQTNDMSLDVARSPSMMRPPTHRVARATHGMRTDVDREPEAVRGVLSLGVMWGCVLLLTGGLATVTSGGWPVVMWATALDGTPVWACGAVAGLMLALGVAAFVVGARADPTSWGLLILAPGLVADGLILAGFAVHDLPNLAGSGGLDVLVRMLFPWPTMLVAVGLCVLALRKAWRAWASDAPGRTGGAAIGVVLAALALFGAVEIVRGAEPMPATSNLAS